MQNLQRPFRLSARAPDTAGTLRAPSARRRRWNRKQAQQAVI
ncbi:MAG: hypothetical protein AVDCRST_MAG42-1262 [uncultured Chthoniobacterales bacterium]|uniref:Uncharacterized protein n=1 Tax=uncultured Chthoniobacterales bacterium TaxID=1836801 RepID=A0A6J4HU69_9BACT|nr:MAG: hypothetical protein AVDCRST_MAG42-1262 [uncultured Chthoniobacterales bacterium]